MTVGVGVVNHAFAGFPKGYDAYGHMSKIKFLVDNFPNADWNYEWYSGQFFSEGSFPPLFHLAGAILVAWLHLSLGDSLIVIAAASFVVIACALYGVVRVAGGSRMAGLIAALVLLSTSAFWAYVLHSGLYPRILGMAFLALFAFSAVLYFNHRSRVAYVAMVASLAAALSTHLLVGAIGVALALALIAFRPETLARRLLDAIALLVPTALVAAYFYLPYVASLSRPAPVPLLTREYAAVAPVAALGGATIEALPWFLLPAAIALVAVAYLSKRLPPSPGGRRLIPVAGIAAAGALTYALGGLPAPGLFIYNFQPSQALFFAAWFLAVAVGVALSGLRLPQWALIAIAVLVGGLVAVSPTRITGGVVSGDNPANAQLQNALHVDPLDRQHRVGVSWDAASDWIDARYTVPQTRGYQQQGVVEGNWQYWLETDVWSAEPNYDEKNFLLDWYAVRSFYGGPDPNVVQDFAARADLYVPQGSSALTFDYLDATEILTARNTRSALVIGSDVAYSYLLRALSLSDFDSRSLIPVRGGAYLDDHSLGELKQFDMVVLYGYQVRDLQRSFAVLSDYVRGGGDVFIEANNSPLASSNAPPSPIPGASIHFANIGPDWRLTAGGSPITQNVALGSFAPATYNGGPWGISYIAESDIRSWAQPVLLSEGRPVLVAGTLGAGHVVWSGMNLPYHAANTKNEAESHLLANAIAWGAVPPQATATFQADFVNPELRRVTVTSPAEGVLLKESWVLNWQATVNGHAAAIYRAGPDFMYVPIPKGTPIPATVELRFTRTSVEWAGDLVSILAVIGLVAWLVEPRIRRRRGRSAS